MLSRTCYAQQPERLDYHSLPDTGLSDAWLRMNIEEVTADDGTYWEADEAYFRTDASRDDIEDDFEGYFDEASGWEPPFSIPVDILQLRADVDYLLMKEEL